MRRIGVKSIEAVIDKRYLSYSLANTMESKNLRALKRPNRSKKYNNNILLLNV